MNEDLFNPPQGECCFAGCHFIKNPYISEECAPFFRKRFVLDSPGKKAIIHLCGVGYHELYINGKKAGDSFLTPPQTLYDKTVYYLTYDVTDLLRQGENSLVVLLGNGLYNCFDAMAWYLDSAPWRDGPKCMLYGCIETEKGTIVTLKSGRDFETGASHIYYNMLFGGESQDFTSFSMEDAPTRPAAITQSPGGILRPCPEPFVKESDPLAPIKITKFSEGKWVYDFGQNRAGWVRVNATAFQRTKVVLRYGELVDEGGELDTSNIDIYSKKGRFQTDEYVLDENHSIVDARPHFAYHGFRYVEVQVTEGKLSDLELTAYALYSDVKKIGQFRCSDATVNKIFELSDVASLSNLVNIPTDCPHREKMGWTGDVSFSAEQMCFHYDIKSFLARWLQSVRDAQRPSGQLTGIVPCHKHVGYSWGSGPVWDSALFELPYEIYRYQNDPEPLKENYEAMKRYLSFLETMADGYITSFGLGDWCPPADTKGIDCPTSVTATAYYYYEATIAAVAAEVSGKPEDQVYYQELANHIRTAFQQKLYDPDTGEVAGCCQTSQGVAIHFGLLEKEQEQKAAQRLASMIRENDGRLRFGVAGAKTVPVSLARYGECQLAYDMLLQEGIPSYRHWVDSGNTALPERWEEINSHNHHMFSDVCRFFVQYIAGLGIPDYARKEMTFTPGFPSQITWAEAKTLTPDGEIFCRWERVNEGIRFTYHLPDSYTAVLLPNTKYKIQRFDEYLLLLLD